MWKWESKEAKGVIVIVHGASEHHGRYEWLKEQWLKEGYHVVIGDLPGQGISTRNRGHISSFDEYIETIVSWVEQAKMYQLPVYLLGHSMGGLAVIRTMQKYQLNVRALLLSSPCLGLVAPPKRWLDTLSKLLNVIAPTAKFDSNLSPGIATRNEQQRQVDAEDSLIVRKVSVRWYRELVTAMVRANEMVSQIPDIPVLILQGGDDQIVDKSVVYRWFNQLDVKDKMYKEFKDLYHEVFNEPERDEVFHIAKHFVTMHE